jgi:hypothetical protein
VTSISWAQRMQEMVVLHGRPDCIGNYFSTCDLGGIREYTPRLCAPEQKVFAYRDGRVGIGFTGTAGTINAVLTGIEDGWATTMVVHWQRQVGTTKNECHLEVVCECVFVYGWGR